MPESSNTVQTFDDFSKVVILTDCRREVKVVAECVPLTRETAKAKIDLRWWTETGRALKREEPDHDWSWAKLFGEVKANVDGYGYGWGVQTRDGELQAAILYSVNAVSMVEKDEAGDEKPAVYINYLATNPRNREHLTTPLPGKYRGAGKALVRLAVAHSYYLGFEGRVNLLPADDPKTLKWYEKFGFQKICVSKSVFFELPTVTASRYLAEMGA